LINIAKIPLLNFANYEIKIPRNSAYGNFHDFVTTLLCGII
jgi:hypothetical protein